MVRFYFYIYIKFSPVTGQKIFENRILAINKFKDWSIEKFKVQLEENYIGL
jgi:hypothetical protein